MALLLCSMWDLAGSGIKPVSPALAGGVLTTEPPGKPLFASLSEKILLSTTSPSQMSINMMVSYSKSQSKKHINGFKILQSLKMVQFSSVTQSCLFAAPCTAARQASLSITNSQNLPKLMSIKSVMSSNHLILCRPLLLPPSIFPSIRVFSDESVLHVRWSKYWK